MKQKERKRIEAWMKKKVKDKIRMAPRLLVDRHFEYRNLNNWKRELNP
jgi:hypothetical protein